VGHLAVVAGAEALAAGDRPAQNFYSVEFHADEVMAAKISNVSCTC
jgi:hypothetical protein